MHQSTVPTEKTGVDMQSNVSSMRAEPMTKDLAYHAYDITVVFCVRLYSAEQCNNATQTYVKQAVDERIVTRVAHCQPVAAEPDDVDVFVSTEQRTSK